MTGERSPPAYTIALSELHHDNQLRLDVKYGVLIEVDSCAVIVDIQDIARETPTIFIDRIFMVFLKY